MATEPAMRHTETPAARITVSSLPRASGPRPSSAPISTPMGMSSIDLLRQVEQHEPERVERRVGADADVVLLVREQEQRAERDQHRRSRRTRRRARRGSRSDRAGSCRHRGRAQRAQCCAGNAGARASAARSRIGAASSTTARAPTTGLTTGEWCRAPATCLSGDRQADVDEEDQHRVPDARVTALARPQLAPAERRCRPAPAP